MKKFYLFLPLFLCSVQKNVYAEENLFLIDKVVAHVGIENIFLSDIKMTAMQLKAQGIMNVTEDQIVEQLFQKAAIISKAKEQTTITRMMEPAIKNDVKKRMSQILKQFHNDKRLMEKYVGMNTSLLKKQIEKNCRDQYLEREMQMQFLKNMHCSHKDVVNFYNFLKKDEKNIPVKEESYEAYELILFLDEDPETLNKLLQIKKKLEEGIPFADLVKEYSQDEGSIATGGELGFYKLNELKKEYEQAALALKPGEVSNIVKTDKGYHIIQLLDFKDGEYNTRHIFLFANNDDLSGLVKKAIDIKQQVLNRKISWNEAITKYSNDDNSKSRLGLFTFGYNDAATEHDIKKEDFDVLHNMKEGEISDPIECIVNDKKAIKIIYLRKKTAAHILNLTDDYEQISDMTKNYKKQLCLEKKMKEIVNKAYISVDRKFIKK